MAKKAISSMRGLRAPETKDIFDRIAYIFPHELSLANYPRRPIVAFNPGAVLRGKDLLIFPRLAFDYYNYTSSMGFFQLDIDGLLEGSIEKPVEARIILWPKELWEFRGCEDPRVWVDAGQRPLLYTGFGYVPDIAPVEKGFSPIWVRG